MPNKVKFAIIGTGMIAERHAKALEASEHAELAGVFDLNYERAKEFSKTNMGMKTYSSFEELLSENNIIITYKNYLYVITKMYYAIAINIDFKTNFCTNYLPFCLDVLKNHELKLGMPRG